ncbi:MAG: hypothetical protein C0618_07675 [Desulfuromonas sp.]|nr:MAG: hypothetical protein C0618_07675 [Desulfuromonas sp.]
MSVLFPEALAIADEVRSWPDSEQQKLTERLDELWRAVRGLTDDERISLSRPCAFLDDAGCCRIYPVRPILCRSVTSTSAEACRAALVEPLFEEKPQVQMNLAQKELFEAVYLGVGDGLERAGIDGRGAKLTGFVRYLLREPVAAHRLLRGEKIDWHEFA